MIPVLPLPYRADALEPFMSSATLRYHHGGHYARYVRWINRQTHGAFDRPIDAYRDALRADDVDLRQAAAQAVAHESFFAGMAPGRTSPSRRLARAVGSTFGTFKAFEDAWVGAGDSVFGSGWVYLVAPAPGKLEIQTLQGGSLPSVRWVALADVWEHAYYLDYPDGRPSYLRNWLRHLLDWPAVELRLASAWGVRAMM